MGEVQPSCKRPPAQAVLQDIAWMACEWLADILQRIQALLAEACHNHDMPATDTVIDLHCACKHECDAHGEHSSTLI